MSNINLFVKRLREAKGWDIATIYCAFYPPFTVDRDCKYIIEENHMVIPAGNIIPLDNTHTRFGEIVEVILDLDDITRVDFIRERKDIKPPAAPQPPESVVKAINEAQQQGGSLILP